MERINNLFSTKQRDILNIYFTAGYPEIQDTVTIIELLDQAGVDMVEIGIPYSDPLADGPTIQDSSQQAIKNGFTLDILFDQIRKARTRTQMPFILMGYLNPVIQYGEDRFFQRCLESGVDGLIIPDMPLHEFENSYQHKLRSLNLGISFLISPQTPNDRIRKIDDLSQGFIYMVSSSSITGAKGEIQDHQIEYFKRIQQMNLYNPRLIGFGISNRETYRTACDYANGVIIGSAFIKALGSGQNSLSEKVHQFINPILNPA